MARWLKELSALPEGLFVLSTHTGNSQLNLRRAFLGPMSGKGKGTMRPASKLAVF